MVHLSGLFIMNFQDIFHLRSIDFSKRKTLGIKASLVGMILITVTTTASIVYLPLSFTSKRNIEAIITQSNEEVALGTSQEVKRLLNSANAANQIIQNSFNYDLVDFEDPKDREAFFLSLLKANPDFTWVQFGFKNGDFLGAQRLTNGQLRSHFRDWSDIEKNTYEQTKTYTDLSSNSRFVEYSGLMSQPFYYSPDRPWYKAAISKPGQQAWSVYVYRSTGMPGIDATISLEKNEETIGVAGVGIELSQLSQFLIKELKGKRDGEIFILNHERELLASTALHDVSSSRRTSIHTELTKLSETQNLLLYHANQAFKDIPIDDNFQEKVLCYSDLESGDVYYVSLASLGYLDWMVGTVTPASSYMGQIQRDRNILVITISIFLITTAGLAVSLSDRVIAQPILAIARAAEAIELQVFELEGLSRLVNRQDELGQLARVFQNMAKQIQVREQQLKRQVKALKIEIDEVKRQKQVKEIVESDFFQDLTSKANSLRNRSKERQK